jgi:tetratricopeptide (TPR) repeat protein
MSGYSTSEVSDLLGLKPHQIRRWVRHALIQPDRGRRGQFRFAFQDVVLLRTVKQLLDAEISSRRAVRVLRSVRDRLPARRTLASVRVYAEGKSVVIRDHDRVWDAESGQACLDFHADARRGEVIEVTHEALIILAEIEAGDSDDWYNLGLDLEPIDAARARDAYERSIDLNPRNADAYVNLGRLQQLAGDPSAAQQNYEIALGLVANHQLALYNMGTLYDERDDLERAVKFYRRAAAVPDAHYNLARICELMGDEVSARRHIRQYRRLLDG